MSKGMTHEQAVEELEALALDALDAFERGAVLAHVAGCAACSAELALLRRTAAELASAVAPVPMSPAQRDRVRARLLARATADRGTTTDAPFLGREVLQLRPTVSTPVVSATPVGRAAAARRGRGTSGWLALAAGIVAVASAGALVKVRRERDDLRDVLRSAAATQGARASALDSLRAEVADRDRMIAGMTGDEVAVMTVAAAGPRAPSGLMFWDQRHDAWTFVAHHLPMPKAGRAYQLWLVTPTAKISAGTFMPSPDGHAVMRATYAMPKDQLAAVAVTDEPSGGSAQPTTEPLLVASK